MLVRSMLASALFITGFGAPAYAEPVQAPAPFRSVEAQKFTSQDLQAFGLTEQEAAKGVDLQAQGYRIVTLTPEEAHAYQAGAITQTEWILIGIGVLIILAVA